MGFTYTDVTVRSPAEPERSWEGRFLVDTGSTDTLVPRDRLDELGLRPYGSDPYELADGSSQIAEFTGARLEFMESDAFVRVVYGPPGCEPLLGVLALESARFEVDPVSQEIRRAKRLRL